MTHVPYEYNRTGYHQEKCTSLTSSNQGAINSINSYLQSSKLQVLQKKCVAKNAHASTFMLHTDLIADIRIRSHRLLQFDDNNSASRCLIHKLDVACSNNFFINYPVNLSCERKPEYLVVYSPSAFDRALTYSLNRTRDLSSERQWSNNFITEAPTCS